MKTTLARLYSVVLLSLASVAPAYTQSRPAGAEPALSDLLRHVPDEAALVVVIPDFGEFIAGVQDFGAIIGVEDLSETEADVRFDDLEVIDLSEQWRARIDECGPLVFVMCEPETEPALICTVEGPGEEPADELIQLKGNILVVAPDAGVMHALNSASGKFAKRFEELGSPMLKTHGLAVFVDVPLWEIQIDPMLSLGEMLSKMGAAAATPGAQANVALVNWMFEGLRTAVDECETAVFGLRIDKDGVRLSEVTSFDRTGRIAEYLGKVRKPDKDPLRGLIAERGMIVVAGEWTLPPDEESLSEQMLNVMFAAAPDNTMDETEWKKITQQAQELYRLIAGFNGVMSFGTDQPGMRVSGIYLTDKPQAFFDGFPALWKLSMPAWKETAPWLSMETVDELETIGSVKARVYRFKVTGLDDEELQRALKTIYGESTTFFAAPIAEGVAYTMGPDDVARQDLEKLLTNKGKPQSDDPQVAGVLKKLSPKPQMFMLLDLPSLVSWGLQFSDMPASEMPNFQTPKDCPYVGLGVYLDEAKCTAELFVPAKAVKVIVDWSEGPAGNTSESEPY